MATGAQVSLSGADAGTFNGTVGAASIYGGAGADTLDFNGAVGAATIDSGAGADSFNFAAAVGAASRCGCQHTLTFADVVSFATLSGLDDDSVLSGDSVAVQSHLQRNGSARSTAEPGQTPSTSTERWSND